MTAPEFSPARQDKALSVIGWITAVITGLTLLLALVAVPILLDSRGGIRAQERSDDIMACRSAFEAELVSGPTALALKAISDYGGDSPEFRAAADKADPVRFIELAELSRTDPSRFLELCHATD